MGVGAVLGAIAAIVFAVFAMGAQGCAAQPLSVSGSATVVPGVVCEWEGDVAAAPLPRGEGLLRCSASPPGLPRFGFDVRGMAAAWLGQPPEPGAWSSK